MEKVEKVVAIMALCVATVLIGITASIMADPMAHRMSLLPDPVPKKPVATVADGGDMVVEYEEHNLGRTRQYSEVDTAQAQHFTDALNGLATKPGATIQLQSSIPLNELQFLTDEQVRSAKDFGTLKDHKSKSERTEADNVRTVNPDKLRR